MLTHARVVCIFHIMFRIKFTVVCVRSFFNMFKSRRSFNIFSVGTEEVRGNGSYTDRLSEGRFDVQHSSDKYPSALARTQLLYHLRCPPEVGWRSPLKPSIPSFRRNYLFHRNTWDFITWLYTTPNNLQLMEGLVEEQRRWLESSCCRIVLCYNTTLSCRMGVGCGKWKLSVKWRVVEKDWTLYNWVVVVVVVYVCVHSNGK